MKRPFISTGRGAAGAPRGETPALCVEQREDPVLGAAAAERDSNLVLLLLPLSLFSTHMLLETEKLIFYSCAQVKFRF